VAPCPVMAAVIMTLRSNFSSLISSPYHLLA
jgi:hypothetical protein